jgi:hypothetical protein
MVSYISMLPFGLIACRRPSLREQVVNEHHAMPDKTMITDIHQLADKRMGLDLAPAPDRHLFLYLGKWADKTMIPDPAAIKIYRLHHGH